MSQRRDRALSQVRRSKAYYDACATLGLLDEDGECELEMQWAGISVNDMTRAVRTRYGEVRDEEIRSA